MTVDGYHNGFMNFHQHSPGGNEPYVFVSDHTHPVHENNFRQTNDEGAAFVRQFEVRPHRSSQDPIMDLRVAGSICYHYGMEAARGAYGEAISAADHVDQNRVQSEWRRVQDQMSRLRDENSDLPDFATREMRLELRSRHLYELYMAPAAARINMGLAEIRTGEPQHVHEGMELISQGLSIRPEAANDPAFMNALVRDCRAAGVPVPDINSLIGGNYNFDGSGPGQQGGFAPPQPGRNPFNPNPQGGRPSFEPNPQGRQPDPQRDQPPFQPRPQAPIPLDHLPANAPDAPTAGDTKNSGQNDNGNNGNDQTAGQPEQKSHFWNVVGSILSGLGLYGVYRWLTRDDGTTSGARWRVWREGDDFEREAHVKAEEKTDENGNKYYVVKDKDGKEQKYTEDEFKKRFRETDNKGEYIDNEKMEQFRAVQSEQARTITDEKGGKTYVKPGDWIVMSDDGSISVVKDREFAETFRPKVEPKGTYDLNGKAAQVRFVDGDKAAVTEPGAKDVAGKKISLSVAEFKSAFEPALRDPSGAVLYRVRKDAPDSVKQKLPNSEELYSFEPAFGTGKVQVQEKVGLREAQVSDLKNPANLKPVFEDSAGGAVKKDAQGRIVEALTADGADIKYEWIGTGKNSKLSSIKTEDATYLRNPKTGNWSKIAKTGEQSRVDGAMGMNPDGSLVTISNDVISVQKMNGDRVVQFAAPKEVHRDTKGRITRIDEPSGDSLTLTWDGDKLVRIESPDSKPWELQPDGTFKNGSQRYLIDLGQDGKFTVTNLGETSLSTMRDAEQQRKDIDKIKDKIKQQDQKQAPTDQRAGKQDALPKQDAPVNQVNPADRVPQGTKNDTTGDPSSTDAPQAQSDAGQNGDANTDNANPTGSGSERQRVSATDGEKASPDVPAGSEVVPGVKMGQRITDANGTWIVSGADGKDVILKLDDGAVKVDRKHLLPFDESQYHEITIPGEKGTFFRRNDGKGDVYMKVNLDRALSGDGSTTKLALVDDLAIKTDKSPMVRDLRKGLSAVQTAKSSDNNTDTNTQQSPSADNNSSPADAAPENRILSPEITTEISSAVGQNDMSDEAVAAAMDAVRAKHVAAGDQKGAQQIADAITRFNDQSDPANADFRSKLKSEIAAKPGAGMDAAAPGAIAEAPLPDIDYKRTTVNGNGTNSENAVVGKQTVADAEMEREALDQINLDQADLKHKLEDPNLSADERAELERMNDGLNRFKDNPVFREKAIEIAREHGLELKPGEGGVGGRLIGATFLLVAVASLVGCSRQSDNYDHHATVQ